MRFPWTRRVLRFAALLLGVSILSFLLTALSGTNPAEYVARRASLSNSPETIRKIEAELGLDRPLVIRYLAWVGGAARGDFGKSVFTGRSISEDLAVVLPATMQLVSLTLLMIVILSIPLALLCAAHRNRWPDHLIRGITVFGICLPPFWLGFVLLILFAVRMPLFSVAPAAGLKGLILPSIALAFPLICSIVRVLRASLLEEMDRDYAVFARAGGMSSGQILRCKALKNALPPTVTLLCQSVSYLIAGSAVVEKVFSIQGIGDYLMRSVIAADSGAIGACMLIVAALYLAAELFGEGVNAALRPRGKGDLCAAQDFD